MAIRRAFYAQRFRSQAGTQEGLYWEAKEGEAESPAGAFIAEATGEGYETGRKRTPFHGYYYRILKGQGAHASGGAKDYVQEGKMTGEVLPSLPIPRSIGAAE